MVSARPSLRPLSAPRTVIFASRASPVAAKISPPIFLVSLDGPKGMTLNPLVPKIRPSDTLMAVADPARERI